MIIFLLLAIFSSGCLLDNEEKEIDKLIRKPIIIYNAEKVNMKQERLMEISIYQEEDIIFHEDINFIDNKYKTELTVESGKRYLIEVNVYNDSELVYNDKIGYFELEDYEVYTVNHKIFQHSNTVIAEEQYNDLE